MPREVRCVLFGRAEMRAMIAEFLFHRAREHKGAKIGRIEFVDDPAGPLAYVHFVPPHVPPLATFHTSALLETILMFCRGHRVPLPRRGIKSVQLAGDEVALISMSGVEEDPTVVGGNVSYSDQSVRALGEALMKAAAARPGKAKA